MGIEPNDLPFIWERFYKADKSRMRTSGTGLGLAVAKLVVELMGGEIGVNTKSRRRLGILLHAQPKKEGGCGTCERRRKD